MKVLWKYSNYVNILFYRLLTHINEVIIEIPFTTSNENYSIFN